MVVSRALIATRCAGCRLSLLKHFVAVAGSSIRVPHASARSACSAQQSRHSSQLTSGDLRVKLQVPREDETGVVGRALNKETTESEETSSPAQLSTIPWYLQVDAPQKAALTLSDRQRIPELPESPPPILQPLLQQLSIDLGLDDISLLDLRKLDPPPALGANLIMLISTARSEKHLHVSADRLCRWLRSQYKLRPSADGLLGRNELKVKLRRKAKRAKLLGGPEDNVDDGIRTGWVCVDVGIVQEAEGMTEIAPPKDFIGFGRRTEGVRLVVQLLTEEKRVEIDLEKLWGGILTRGGQAEIEDSPEQSLQGGRPDMDVIIETVELENQSDVAGVDPALASGQPASSILSSNTSVFDSPSAKLPKLRQKREYHAGAVYSQLAQDTSTAHFEAPPGQTVSTSLQGFDIEEIQEAILMLFNSGDSTLR